MQVGLFPYTRTTMTVAKCNASLKSDDFIGTAEGVSHKCSFSYEDILAGVAKRQLV
jgi:hypothetical protein